MKVASSTNVDIVRSPQDVIDDFIINHIGDFDLSDKYADPQNLYKEDYDELKKYWDQFEVESYNYCFQSYDWFENWANNFL